MRIALTRFGGAVSFLRSDLFHSNTNLSDYYLIKSICTCGIQIDIITRPSRSLLQLFDQWTEHPEYEPWMENLNCVYEEDPDVNSYDMLFITQGAENLRLTSQYNVSSQYWVYRALRNFEGPVWYINFDTYIPLWIVPETRVGEEGMYYTANTRDTFHNKSINVFCAGNNPEMYSRVYDTWGVSKYINFLTLAFDGHDLLHRMLDEWDDKFEFDGWNIDRLAFVGKDRNGGSRYNYFMESVQKNPNLQLDLYGNWKKADFKEYTDNQITWHGQLPRGSSPVMDVYNSHIAAPVIANDRYIKANQFTARVYEVISSKTLPLIEIGWAKKFREYLPEDLIREIIFSTETLGNKYDKLKANPDYRNRLVKEVYTEFRKSVKSHLPEKGILDLITQSQSFSKNNGEIVQKEIGEFRFEADKESKYTRTRNNAESKRAEWINYYSKEVTQPKSLPRDIFGFNEATIDNEQLIKMFGRNE
ncbi:beta glucosyl transferase [Maribacter phage Molly_5]|uniref:Beta glucosyl transferase n=1 Tax=Maribacter phage Molly_1 TaxID=2745685 RepID=A0A8E4XY23_9CAUD|nr:beta glucosyl transferase [Maribacter phage Molly_1]QQO97592.1 beta glucosyl transferase [Maribacter phage Molly_2]QQO97792.1 beta glucosyl transferase [Maribacter phage Molly_3]QQO97992.1 beta glucosyl transferase [Maribacter phage Molly_4]QQO98192.1 beta glucosyl transferase [Maribacter phage Molly_5]QQO97392.1 beta glucosyl transferase [Maribacter phage Molly_1]